jgi:hypothetical protein
MLQGALAHTLVSFQLQAIDDFPYRSFCSVVCNLYFFNITSILRVCYDRNLAGNGSDDLRYLCSFLSEKMILLRVVPELFFCRRTDCCTIMPS